MYRRGAILLITFYLAFSNDARFLRRKRQDDTNAALEQPQTLDINGDYLNYAKYLLVLANNYSIAADKLACTDIDPKKEFLMKFDDNSGLRVCDVCPYLPFSKFKNLLVNVVPLELNNNIPFSDCFGACSARNDCVAYSYDHESSICYSFNSTRGKFRSESNWTTVLMNQPTGIINKWSYSRHTVISGSNGSNTLPTSTQNSFLTCLDLCENTKGCRAVSYRFASKSCALFTSFSSDSGNFVDFEYGVVSAFDLELVNAPESNNWRFIEETQLESNVSENVVFSPTPNSSKCKSPGDGLGSFYAMKCLTVQALGCDSTTGCQSCYYPEKINSYRSDLIICPDSTFINGRNQREKLASCYNDCIGNKDCIAVDFDPTRLTCDVVLFSAWRPKDLTISDVRRYALKFSKLLPNLASFFILPKHNLGTIPQSKTWVEEISNSTLDGCFTACLQRNSCDKIAFSAKKGVCRMTSTSATTIDNQQVKDVDEFHVFIRQSNLTSLLLSYQKIPGWKLVGKGDIVKEVFDCGNDDCSKQLLHCAELCSSKYSKWCNLISTDYEANRVTCYYFNGTEESDLVPSQTSEVLNRYFQTDINLEELDARDAFEEKDFYNCFGNSSDPTLSSLSGYEKILTDSGDSDNTQLSRRRRGFFSAIGNFFKKAVKAVGNVIKDTVKTVVDTAKGVANTIGKVVQGDFKGAKDSFLKIPIVNDVKEAGENVIKIGKSVVKGDWKGVGNAALGLATSNLLDFVPGVGRVAKGAGTIIKDVVEKGVKKGGKDVGQKAKGEIGDKAAKDRVNGDKDPNNPNKDKERPDNKKDNDQPDRCKRAPNTRTTPGSNSPNCNKPNNDKCFKPNIANVMTPSLTNCGFKRERQSCNFYCEPGYSESGRGKITCDGVGTGNSKRLEWKPRPDCELTSCGPTPSAYKLIPIQVPPAFGVGPDRTAFVSYFDVIRRLPVWSVALHDVVNKASLFSRKAVAGFLPHPCRELATSQATAAEYRSSGWHQGHLTPINVMLYHRKAAKGSNLFINIAPQSPPINTGAWANLEMKVQCFTKTVSAIVATGLCRQSQGVVLLPTYLSVPTCYWKMLCYKDKSGNTQVVGFVATNDKMGKTDLVKKKAARQSLFTPRSQGYIRSFAGQGNQFYLGSTLSDPWLLSAPYIFGGGASSIIDVTKCNSATNLDPAVEKEWKDRLTTVKKRGKRDVSLSGCSLEEEEELAALFGIDDFDQDEDAIDNADENNEDNPDGTGDGSKFAGASCGKRLIGYYPSWGDKEITYQQASRLTHIVFAFFETKSDGTIVLGSADPNNSPDPSGDANVAKKRLDKLLKIEKLYSNLQILFAVGGWENSQYFSNIAASADGRINFIANTIKIIQEYGFDGIDIDWEYPVTGGAHEGIPSDKENYVQLMKELRQALDQHQKQVGRATPFLISFAGAAGQWTLDPGFDLPGLLKYADWVNVMTYDFFGAWDSKWGAYTGPPAPLYFAMPPRFSGKTNVDWTIKYYSCRTQQPHKINMGVPFYGRFWRNVGAPIDPSDDMWRLAEAVGGKFLGGYEPWRKLKDGWLNDPAFKKSFHEKAKTPYAFNAGEKIFLGYEDPQSLKFKVDYAAEHNVGGLMIWAIDQDDDQNTMLNTLVSAPLCKNTDPKAVMYKCSPINDKRWWTSEDGDDVAGLCGRSAPLYKGYYPVCDPDDPGYSCCGAFGYCGTGDAYCKCSTCVDYRNFPERILDEPVKPTVPVLWYFLNAVDGKRGRCGRDVDKINNEFPICNPDDNNAHCCSNGGYCGNTPAHCTCNGCIDFKQRKDYRFSPKKWWIVADGQDKAGKCGPNAPKINGGEAECNPDDPGFHCCSPSGFCGSGADYCTCKGCKEFKS